MPESSLLSQQEDLNSNIELSIEDSTLSHSQLQSRSILRGDPVSPQNNRLLAPSSNERQNVNPKRFMIVNDSVELSVSHDLSMQETEVKEALIDSDSPAKEKPKGSTMGELISSFSMINAVKEIKRTRCYAWDN